MTIDTQLVILTVGLTIGNTVATWQAGQLHNEYQSKSSIVGVLAFLLLAVRQSYTLLRLKHTIAEARAAGYNIDHLTKEQWIIGVIFPYAITGLFIWWLTWKRIDNNKLEKDLDEEGETTDA